MVIKNIVVFREKFSVKEASPTSNSFNPEMIFDYLTIYDEGGKILKRSIGYAKDLDITLNYNGIDFVSRPGYTSDKIYITFDSFMNYINREVKNNEE